MLQLMQNPSPQRALWTRCTGPTGTLHAVGRSSPPSTSSGATWGSTQKCCSWSWAATMRREGISSCPTTATLVRPQKIQGEAQKSRVDVFTVQRAPPLTCFMLQNQISTFNFGIPLQHMPWIYTTTFSFHDSCLFSNISSVPFQSNRPVQTCWSLKLVTKQKVVVPKETPPMCIGIVDSLWRL